jgi:hypothetical protein
MRWHQALQQLVMVLQVSCSACMAAVALKGSLTASKLSAIVSLLTAALDGCATLLLRGPPADGLSREQQQQMREVLLSQLLDYGNCLLVNGGSTVSLAQRLGHDSCGPAGGRARH